jgi:hypothetical protein
MEAGKVRRPQDWLIIAGKFMGNLQSAREQQ